MKILLRHVMVLGLLFSPLLLGCGPSRVSEESTLEQIEAEAEQEAQEPDVLAESEDG
jgi:hypothetical protein